MGHCLFLRKGEVHTAPVTGVLASSLAVGSTVKLMEGGTAVEYLVVNQGIPENSNLYDTSCDGTWLLRKDCYENGQWDTANLTAYNTSNINHYLNNEFFGLLESNIKNVIKQVRIPYLSNGKTQQGAYGLSCKIFLLSAPEVHYEHKLIASGEGAALSYFASCVTNKADPKRIAYYNGSVALWWLRSPRTDNNYNVWYIFSDGNCYNTNASDKRGIRPALVLPGNALFDKTTMLLKGVK